MRWVSYGAYDWCYKPPDDSRELTEQEQFARNELIASIVRWWSIQVMDEYSRRAVYMAKVLGVVDYLQWSMSIEQVENMDTEWFDFILTLMTEKAHQNKTKAT